MGTYTTIVCQKKINNQWVIVLPIGHGYNAEIPHSYGKLDMMDVIDKSLGFNLKSDTRIHSRRQDFQSPGEYTEPNERAPWSGRGYPEDMDDRVKEIFEGAYHDDASWVMVDEILAYDFDKELVGTGYHDEVVTWTEHLKPAYRMWFENIKALGVERVIYTNH